MQSWIQLVSVPTADVNGTAILLQVDSKRYVFGQLSEGTLRTMQYGNASLRAVSNVFVSGSLSWNNMGGLCGIALLLAEIRSEARLSLPKDKQSSTAEPVSIYGPQNLNYGLATMRRFIFRTGTPLNVTEVSQEQNQPTFSAGHKEPTWSDGKIGVWAMSVVPEHEPMTPPESKKRPYSAMQEPNGDFKDSRQVYKDVVRDMFSSNWTARQLVKAQLPQVKMPAAIFVRDPVTRKVENYSGPLPGGEEPVPNIEVLVRLPWPGARVEELPPVQPMKDSVSYIVTHPPQRGKFLPKKALELKVPKGAAFGKLTQGISVENSDGELITPDMVMEPGRPGKGFAIVDIPSTAYVKPLLARSEWIDSDLMASVNVIVWVLGPGVEGDPSIKEFQDSHTDIHHVVSSGGSCPDEFSFRSAAEVSWLRNFVDPSTYPGLTTQQQEEIYLPGATEISDLNASNVMRAERGLTVLLEPQVRIKADGIEKPLNVPELQEAVKNDMTRLGIDVPAIQTKLDLEEANSWLQSIPDKDTEVITLGTGSGNPGVMRNVSGTLVRVPGQGSYLLDCGEGTLGTLRRLYSKEELANLMRDLKLIWISHLHADHHIGLTSLIREWSQTVYGNVSADEIPEDAPRLVVASHIHMLKWLEEFSHVDDMGYSKVIPLRLIPSKADVLKPPTAQDHRDKPDGEIQTKPLSDYLDMMNLSDLSCVFVNHCYGAMAMSATTKSGFKFSFSGDCRPNTDFTRIGQGSHALIHEATFEDQLVSEARTKKHSTAGEALIVADKMGAKAVVLTHLSQRYSHGTSLAPSIAQHEATPNEDIEANGGSHQAVDASPEAASSVGQEPLTSSANSKAHTQEVLRILQTTPLKVVTAFDYMMLKVRDIPKIQNLQPVLQTLADNRRQLTSLGKVAEDTVEISEAQEPEEGS